MGYVTWPRPFQGHFVIRRLGLAMFNPHIKFETYTITCNEEVKGHAKLRIFVLSYPFGDVGVTYTVHLWLNGKCVVDFLLVIIRFCLLALTPTALLSEICRNRRFSTGWVTLSANFRQIGTSPAIHLWTVRQSNHVSSHSYRLSLQCMSGVV